jgi:co-chaperonin GroES (HSP10)
VNAKGQGFIPHGSRVLIRPDPLPDRSKGGIYYPETSIGKDKNYALRSGVVVAMGPGFLIVRGKRMGERWPMPNGSRPDVSPDVRGKRVYYFAGDGIVTEREIDGVVHHIVRADNIDAYEEDEEQAFELTESEPAMAGE